MLQYDRLWECLTDIGVGDWRSRIEALLHLRLSRAGHGDFIEWQETLTALNAADPTDTAAPGCFTRMPASAPQLLETEAELVRDWIDSGARR